MDLMTSQEVNTTFNDVKGCDEVKDRNLGLFDIGPGPWKNLEKTAIFGRKLKMFGS